MKNLLARHNLAVRMRLRLATTRDLPRLTMITVSSLRDDPTFPYMWVHEKEYPDDNFFFWQQRLKRDLYDPDLTFMVAVTEPGDLPTKTADPPAEPGPVENIMSYAIWERYGTTKSAKEYFDSKNTGLNVVDEAAYKLETWSIEKKYTRRDSDPKRTAAFGKAAGEAYNKHFYTFDDIWAMNLLVTDRQWRKRGAASALIKWGVDMADKENLPCGVISSPMGEPLYKASGFEEVGRMIVQVPGDSASLNCAVMLRPAKL